jgi:predicted nucleic acid-binding protein
MPAQPESLILDANLLVLLVVGSVDERQVPTFKRTRAYTRDDFRLLLGFMSRFGTLMVTPHILTEATNLLDDLKEPMRTTAFGFLRELISRSEERFEKSAELAGRRQFVRLGLADTAVHSVAEAGAALLTADLDLYLAASATSRHAVNFNHLRSGAWGL